MSVYHKIIRDTAWHIDTFSVDHVFVEVVSGTLRRDGLAGVPDGQVVMMGVSGT